MAASFLALAAARRSSRERAGLFMSSSEEEDSSSEDSSSDDEASAVLRSATSFPSASSGRRFLEKCLPPGIELLVKWSF